MWGGEGETIHVSGECCGVGKHTGTVPGDRLSFAPLTSQRASQSATQPDGGVGRW